MKNKTTRFIVGNALLIALTVVFTMINIPITPGVSLNLSLVTIALASIIYGWKSGLFVGLVNGALVIISAGIFLAENPVATIIICLLKSGVAGLISGLLFNLIKGKNEIIAVLLASLIIPIVNTSIYVLGIYLFFSYEFFIAVLPSLLNFAIEVAVSILLSPTVYYVLKVFKQRHLN